MLLFGFSVLRKLKSVVDTHCDFSVDGFTIVVWLCHYSPIRFRWPFVGRCEEVASKRVLNKTSLGFRNRQIYAGLSGDTILGV